MLPDCSSTMSLIVSEPVMSTTVATESPSAAS